MMEQGIRKGEREWKPDIRLKSLYRIYLLLLVWVGILTWLVPLVFLIPALWSLIITVPLFITVILASLWIPWYYQTLAYTFTNDEIIWQRGVWFRQTGIVPYNRITNIDLIQGPIMRRVGVSTLKIQTADIPHHPAQNPRYGSRVRTSLKNYVTWFWGLSGATARSLSRPGPGRTTPPGSNRSMRNLSGFGHCWKKNGKNEIS